MSTQPSTIEKHQTTMKQHLAGVAGARAWIQDLTAAHLLDTQAPIRDEPIANEPPVKP